MIEHAVELAVPVRTAYDQMTQFEELPRLLGDVAEVTQVDETHLRLVLQAGGRRHELDGRITEQLPDDRIVWASTHGPRAAAVLRFESVDEARARLVVQLDVGGEGSLDLPDEAAEEVRRRLAADLETFAAAVAERGQATGAWRGAITGGQVSPDVGASRAYADGTGASRTRLESHEASGGHPDARGTSEPLAADADTPGATQER